MGILLAYILRVNIFPRILMNGGQQVRVRIWDVSVKIKLETCRHKQAIPKVWSRPGAGFPSESSNNEVAILKV